MCCLVLLFFKRFSEAEAKLSDLMGDYYLVGGEALIPSQISKKERKYIYIYRVEKSWKLFNLKNVLMIGFSDFRKVTTSCI